MLLAGIWQRSGSAAGRTTCPTPMALQLSPVKVRAAARSALPCMATQLGTSPSDSRTTCYTWTLLCLLSSGSFSSCVASLATLNSYPGFKVIQYHVLSISCDITSLDCLVETDPWQPLCSPLRRSHFWSLQLYT